MYFPKNLFFPIICLFFFNLAPYNSSIKAFLNFLYTQLRFYSQLEQILLQQWGQWVEKDSHCLTVGVSCLYISDANAFSDGQPSNICYAMDFRLSKKEKNQWSSLKCWVRCSSTVTREEYAHRLLLCYALWTNIASQSIWGNGHPFWFVWWKMQKKRYTLLLTCT